MNRTGFLFVQRPASARFRLGKKRLRASRRNRTNRTMPCIREQVANILNDARVRRPEGIELGSDITLVSGQIVRQSIDLQNER